MSEKENGKIRRFWVEQMLRIAMPVLTALQEDKLRSRMPVYAAAGVHDRRDCTYLEAFGRTLLGIAPWLARKAADETEEALRANCAQVCRAAMRNAVTPGTADCMNFNKGMQPLVDAAFLAQAILRAPTELYEKLDVQTKTHLIEQMRSTRCIKPCENNWLLFSAMVELFLRFAGADWQPERVEYAVEKHMQWYKGDGAYGDGEWFHFDYYNSLVMHPMLCDCVRLAGEALPVLRKYREPILQRAARCAGVLEQLIGADGSYPVIGRSSCYRFGVFHALAQAAAENRLPVGCEPSQVRGALTAVLRKLLSYADMFDEKGWLTIGVCGKQPHMGEGYISTGSLYLCTAIFLPLGLPGDAPFWADADCDWTAKKIWSGKDAAADHAMGE